MPKKFDRLVKRGAKVRTKKLPGGKFIRVAIRPSGKGPRGGKTVAGEVKKRK